MSYQMFGELGCTSQWLSLPVEIIYKILINLESCDILSLLKIKELSWFWYGLINVVILDGSKLAYDIPLTLITTTENEGPTPLISLIISYHERHLSDLLNTYYRNLSVAKDVFILILEQERYELAGETIPRLENSVVNVAVDDIERVFNNNKNTIKSLEFQSKGLILERCMISEEYIVHSSKAIFLELSQVNFNVVNKGNQHKRFDLPNLDILVIGHCQNFETHYDLFNYPRVTSLHDVLVMPLLRCPNSNIFENIESLTIENYTDFVSFDQHSFHLPKLKNLVFKTFNLKSISNVIAPNLENFECKTCGDISITNCQFDSLTKFKIDTTCIAKMKLNHTPSLKKMTACSLPLQVLKFDELDMFQSLDELTFKLPWLMVNGLELENLTRLNIVGRGNGPLHFFAINHATTTLENLKILCLYKCVLDYSIDMVVPNLKTLSMTDCQVEDYDFLNKIPTTFPKLRELRWIGGFHVCHESFPVSTYSFSNHEMPELETLVFKFSTEQRFSNYNDITEFKILNCDFPKLKNLVLDYLYTDGHELESWNNNELQINAPKLRYISLNNANFENLDLSNCYNIKGLKLGNNITRLNIPHSQKIEYLDMSFSRPVEFNIGPLDNVKEIVHHPKYLSPSAHLTMFPFFHKGTFLLNVEEELHADLYQGFFHEVIKFYNETDPSLVQEILRRHPNVGPLRSLDTP